MTRSSSKITSDQLQGSRTFSETSFISGKLPPRHRVYVPGHVRKYFSRGSNYAKNIPILRAILLEIESHFTNVRLINFTSLKRAVLIHVVCDRCVKETLCLLDYHWLCSRYHIYAFILLPHFARSILLKKSSATSAIFYFIMYELTNREQTSAKKKLAVFNKSHAAVSARDICF